MYHFHGQASEKNHSILLASYTISRNGVVPASKSHRRYLKINWGISQDKNRISKDTTIFFVKVQTSAHRR